MRFSCDSCPSSFSEKRKLLYHVVQRHHMHIIGTRCDLCPYTSICERDLRFHIESAHGSPLVRRVCDDCGLGFASRDYRVLTRHWAVFHCRRLDLHHCDEDGCQYSSPSRQHLASHWGSAHGRVDVAAFCLLRCDDCDVVFRDPRILWRHFLRLHLGVFRSEATRLRAYASSAEPRLVKSGCDDCSATFYNDGKNLINHWMRNHNYDARLEDGTCRCDDCYFTAIRPSYLVQHMFKHRRLLRPKWPCDDCGRGFASANSLGAHCIRRHVRR